MGKRKVLFRAAALALAVSGIRGRSQFKRKTDSTGTARCERHKQLYVDYSYK